MPDESVLAAVFEHSSYDLRQVLDRRFCHGPCAVKRATFCTKSLLSELHAMQKPLGGVVGVIFALILETVLFMARANMQTNAGMKYEHLWDPEGAKKKKQKPTPAGTPFTTQPKSKKVDTTGTDTKKDQ